MNLDRNTIFGFVLLAVLFIGYFVYTSNEQKSYKAEKARIDSLANANLPKVAPEVLKADSLRNDTLTRIANAGNFKDAASGLEQITEVETGLLKIGFTNKGGQPKWVALKNYKGPDSNFVQLANNKADKISYIINTGNNSTALSSELFFSTSGAVKNADGSITIQYQLAGGDSTASVPAVTHSYTIKPEDYLVGFNIHLNNATHLVTNGQLNLNWHYTANRQEVDLTYERANTQVGYIEDGEFDYHTIGRKSQVTFDKPVKWVGVRQRFFNTFLIADNNFQSGNMKWQEPASGDIIVQSTANMAIAIPVAPTVNIPLHIYYGPADLHTLKKYNYDLEDLVNFGQGIYAFVRPINRYLILPVWDFIKSFNIGFGLVIALLTLFIRLIISPLTYKSYLSGARMRALRPELNVLKEKHGSDQQAYSMDQMKLFREAGVSPLGGCIPALLQIPIFFALYSFFNANIDLRGAEFWWANDLSSFDDVIKFGFKIPLLGAHLSIFTLLATVTSLITSVYSMSLTPDQSNPMLKYMPYIFPVFMLFIFNSMPAALTWYYTVSNLISLLLQFIIQNYIIDHDKIMAKISENRKKPKSKSKWQERMEQMQEQQKKMKELQNKTNKK